MSDRPSIRDVARASGFSPSTVSKALNGHKEINEETAAVIRDRAALLGYNSAAGPVLPVRRDRRSRERLMLVRPDRDYSPRHLQICSFCDIFCLKAAEAGCQVIIPARREADGFLHLAEAEADGALLICAEDQLYRPDIAGLLQSTLPVVTICRQAEGCICLQPDLCAGIHAVLQHVWERGHRKIVLFCRDRTREDRIFRAVFLREAARRGIPDPQKCLCMLRDDGRAELERQSRRTLAVQDPPTCLLCQDDIMACREMEILESIGVAVPREISVAGFGQMPESSFAHPALTTYGLDMERAAEEALRCLLQDIHNPLWRLPETVPIPGRLIRGASTGQCI